MPSDTAPRVLARLRAGEAYDRFTRWTELPMLALSVVFLAVLVIPVLDETLPAGWLDAFAVTDTVVWAIFAADYLIRLALAPQPRRFVVRHIPDLIVIVVPVLRTLRLVRLVRLIRFARSGAVATRLTQHSRAHLHVSAAIRIAATAVIVMFVGAVGMLDVERHAVGANIRTFGDAVWWALTTLTTVGYGDRYPVTVEGRLIAAVVMLTGIAVLGVVTASMAAWFVDKVQAIEQAETSQSEHDRHVDATLAAVLEKLARLEARSAAASPPASTARSVTIHNGLSGPQT
ncbi:potassium channel family protein [Amycolatopsis sp. NPDC048633]|uniref:potassium channel family protein n=1 Tax=Amycolatopsis sp. NPDC048633 TaxID=3157095 RepID=UPI0033D4DB58